MAYIPLGEVLLVWAVLISTISAIAYNSAPGYQCSFGQPCWPSIQEWESFNSSLSENLYDTIPYAASCYYESPFYDLSTCALIARNYTIDEASTSVPGATNALNWESCLSHTCALNAQDTIYQPELCSLVFLYWVY